MSIVRWLLAAGLTLSAAGAGHAQTASFSTLGLPALFGPESQATASVLPYVPGAGVRTVIGILPIGDEPEALPCPALCQIAMNPEFLPECMRQWQEQWQRGNFKEAQSIAAIACRLNPHNVEARHALIISDIMVAHCHDDLDSESKVRALLQSYRTLLREGKLSEALALAQKAKELDPDNLAADAAIQIAMMKTHAIEYAPRSLMRVEDTPSDAPAEPKIKKKLVTLDIADLVCDGPKQTCGVVAPLNDLPSESASVEQLVKAIQNTVAPETWQCVGGQGSIQYYPLGKALVINNTNDVLEGVTDFLASLRQMVDHQGNLVRARLDQQKAEADRQMNRLMLNIETAYWKLYAARGALKANDEALTLLHRMGVMQHHQDLLDVLAQVRGQYEEFRGERTNALGAVFEAERNLRGLLGLPPEDGTRLALTTEANVQWSHPDPEAIWRDAQLRRPELILAREALRYHETILQRAKQSQDHSVRLTGGRERDGETNVNLRSALVQVAQASDVVKDMENRVKSALVKEFEDLRKWYRLVEERRAERRAYADSLAKKLSAVEAGNRPADLDILDVQRRLTLAQVKECAAVAEYCAALARYDHARGAISETGMPRVSVRAATVTSDDDQKHWRLRSPAGTGTAPTGLLLEDFKINVNGASGLIPAGALTADLGCADAKACCKEGGNCAIAGAAKPTSPTAAAGTVKCSCCGNDCACCKCGNADGSVGATFMQFVPMFFDGPAAWLAPQPDPLTQVLEMVINAAMDKVAVAGQTEIAPAAAGQRVHLSTPHFEAHCQRMTSSGTSDHLLLEGDVELFTKRHGQSLRVQGQRIVVHLSDGAFTVEATSTPPQPIAPAPAQSMVPASVFVPVQPAAYIAPLMDWQIVRPVRPVNEWLDLPPKPNE